MLSTVYSGFLTGHLDNRLRAIMWMKHARALQRNTFCSRIPAYIRLLRVPRFRNVERPIQSLRLFHASIQIRYRQSRYNRS